jgi:hypothetical protein
MSTGLGSLLACNGSTRPAYAPRHLRGRVPTLRCFSGNSATLSDPSVPIGPACWAMAIGPGSLAVGSLDAQMAHAIAAAPNCQCSPPEGGLVADPKCHDRLLEASRAASDNRQDN